MGTVVAIGEAVKIAGFGLTGAIVFECETPAEVRQAWDALPDDVLTVIVTPAADEALRATSGREAGPPVVVMLS